jgi:hypothetical protein
MIFNFLKYIKPTWYYNLKPQKDFGYFPTEEQLRASGYSLEKDLNYSSEEAQKRDLAWRAFQQGFISKTQAPGMAIWQPVKLPVIDEYRFLRKNFSPFWVLYVLKLRLITLKNPIKEISAFLKTRRVKREAFAERPFTHTDYETFESDLINQNPLVSVIIPTLNRYDYLRDVLKDLEKQTYTHFEVIVVDQTDEYREDFYKGWNLDLTYWYQEEKALWKARNEAIKASKGEFILLYDDDSLIESDWITQHLKALDYFQADLSSGVSISVVGAKVPEHYSIFRWSEQLDTGNVLIKKEVFRHIGLFDRQFEKQRMGDGEYGLRAYLNGFKNISNPYAKRIHLKVAQGGLRQMGSWDGWRPKKLLAPRPVPSVLYLSRTYFGTKKTLLMIMTSILPSVVPYRFKANKFLKLLTVLLFPVLLPLVVLQVGLSWKQSGVKLKQGSLIEKM